MARLKRDCLYVLFNLVFRFCISLIEILWLFMLHILMWVIRVCDHPMDPLEMGLLLLSNKIELQRYCHNLILCFEVAIDSITNASHVF